MPENIGSRFPELMEVMSILLSQNGCPWDREQDLQSLRPYLIEECFELVDAIDAKDVENHREELGDLLFQIAFQSALRADEGEFDVDDVIGGIVDKLHSRHPHVFSDAQVGSATEALARWEQLKVAEKKAKGENLGHLLDRVPKALPALSRAQKISTKVAQVGFDWNTADDCLAKVREETDEVSEALATGDSGAVEEEIGDLFFATTCLARKLGIDSSACLAAANRKFETRFARLEDRLGELGRGPKDSTLAEMDKIWDEIKHLP